MNAKVQEFIEKMKAEEQKRREEHLISLGLIDEEKSFIGKKYFDKWDGTSSCHFDNQENKYFKEMKIEVALDVTEEEYQEILKYSPLTKKKETEIQSIDITYSDAINIVAKILLFGNIIGGLILFFALSDSYISWVVIAIAIANALYYPLIKGFAKIVAVAEKKLAE